MKIGRGASFKSNRSERVRNRRAAAEGNVAEVHGIAGLCAGCAVNNGMTVTAWWSAIATTMFMLEQ